MEIPGILGIYGNDRSQVIPKYSQVILLFNSIPMISPFIQLVFKVGYHWITSLDGTLESSRMVIGMSTTTFIPMTNPLVMTNIAIESGKQIHSYACLPEANSDLKSVWTFRIHHFMVVYFRLRRA